VEVTPWSGGQGQLTGPEHRSRQRARSLSFGTASHLQSKDRRHIAAQLLETIRYAEPWHGPGLLPGHTLNLPPLGLNMSVTLKGCSLVVA